MPMTYDFEVEGLDVRGNTWSHSGQLLLNSPGDFMSLPTKAMQLSFVALTRGEAKYGNPGAGCKGPYEVTRLLVSEQKLLRTEGT